MATLKSKLLTLATSSSLNSITLLHAGEPITFNLAVELAINRHNLNRDLENQPQIYGFLCNILAELNRAKAETEVDKKRLYGKLFIKYKDNGLSDKNAASQVESKSEYVKLSHKLARIKYETELVDSCVRAFEQRASLIQTLSANLRKET